MSNKLSTPMSYEDIIKELTLRQNAIGIERDKLRELESEVEDQIANVEDVLDCLSGAIDKLSELV